MAWSDVAKYVSALKDLLAGREVEWDGRVIRMIHPEGFSATCPVSVPILIGADGPKGMAVAAQLGDGVFSAGIPHEAPDGIDWRALLQFGTVIDEGEDFASPRVAAAGGPALAVVFHALYERNGADAVDALPGGVRWRQSVEMQPADRRHLAVHRGHLVAQNEHDLEAWSEAAPLLTSFSLTGTAPEVRARLDQFEEAGVTEVAYQPAGPDIGRELAAFASAAGLG
jgi:5,10-methylenetetrahydromethanopterin reductase